MKKYILLFSISLVLFASPNRAIAKKTYKYIAAEIPNDLKENAKAVVRIDEVVFTVHSKRRANSKIKFAVTILKKNGDGFATFGKYYNKFSSIKNLNICIYDADGVLIKKVKDSDINDYAASGYSLFADSRVKHYEPVINSYP